MEDMVHIKKCLNGQKDAFEFLVTKYKNLVYSLALNTLLNKNDAADVTQEVFEGLGLTCPDTTLNLPLKPGLQELR